MRLLIRDQNTTPQRFNLLLLLGCLVDVPGLDVATWSVSRAEGYGSEIKRLDDLLTADEDRVVLSVEELAALLPGVDNWFYWLEAEAVDAPVGFGLVDSSFMYVDGPAHVIERLRRPFDEIEEVESPSSVGRA